MRQRISSSAPWESIVGYSRAVRVDRMIFVSGTTAMNESGSLVGVGDVYAQTIQALKNIDAAVAAAGATREDIVRTRMFVVNIEEWKEIARAHEEFFGEIRPATTMVQVSRLIDPAMLVEIEADAVLPT